MQRHIWEREVAYFRTEEGITREMTPEEIKAMKDAGKMVDTATVCSCPLCSE
jgi:hypothetical protein